MTKSIWFGLIFAVAAGIGAQNGAQAQGPALISPAPKGMNPRKNSPPPANTPADDERTLYALGVLISHNLEEFQLSAEEFERVKAGLTDGFEHRATQVDLTLDTPKIQALRRDRADRLAGKLQEEAQAYVDKAATLPGARRTASGLVMIPMHAGTGPRPGPSDRVAVNYEGKLIDGTVFDGSAPGSGPATFSMSAVIPCWSEALPLMKVGEKSRIVCPPALAYGARGAPPKIGPQATLDFEVKLLSISSQAASGPQGAPSASGAPVAGARGGGTGAIP